MFFLEKWRAHKRRKRLDNSLDLLMNKRRQLTIKEIEAFLSDIDVFELAKAYTPARGRLEADFYYTPASLRDAIEAMATAISDDNLVGSHVLSKETKSQYFEEWFTENGYYLQMGPYLAALIPMLRKLTFAIEGAQLTRPDRASYYARMCKPVCNDMIILTTLLYQMELGYV